MGGEDWKQEPEIVARSGPPDSRAPRSGRQRPGSGGAGGPAEPPSKSWALPLWLWLLTLLAVLAWIFYAYLVPNETPRATLSYSDFLAQVAAGNVTEVDITGQQATGSLQTPIVEFPSAVSPATAQAGATPAAGDDSATAGAQTYSQFETTLPPFTDPNLLPLLEQHHVTLVMHEGGGQSPLVTLLVNALPFLLFAGLMYLFYRQGRGTQQQMFGFGRSHARVHTGEEPTVMLSDVAGEDEAKAELAEVVDFLKEPLKYTKMGASLPRGVLLVGPPGTGKTLLARAVAGEAGVPFFSISGSEFVEMFVGVGASRVRDLFEQAKKSVPCIVFVDELDAVGRQRGAGLGGGNDEREQTLNQILVEMDGFDRETSLIVMAATNRPDVLDPALLRPGRFDRQVTMGLPDRTGRVAILGVHTRGKPLAPDVDITLLARSTPGFSGADLSNLANEAALSAARLNHTEITAADFEAALETIVFGTKQATLMSEEERQTIAYHESGHALVATLTPGAEPVQKITIIPHGRALGATQQMALDERHNYSRDYLLARLAVMLGGRAAEEVAFQDVTTGAADDLKAATELARRMVGIWGMSEELGPVYLGVGEEHPFLGRVMAQERAYGDQTASAVDAAVQRLVEHAHQRASELIAQHRAALDGLARALLQQETLHGSEVRAVLDEAPAAGGAGSAAA